MSFPIPTPTPLAHSLLLHCNTNAPFIAHHGISTPYHRPFHKTYFFGTEEGKTVGGGQGTQPFTGRINTCSCIPRNPAVHPAVTTAQDNTWASNQCTAIAFSREGPQSSLSFFVSTVYFQAVWDASTLLCSSAQSHLSNMLPYFYLKEKLCDCSF